MANPLLPFDPPAHHQEADETNDQLIAGINVDCDFYRTSAEEVLYCSSRIGKRLTILRSRTPHGEWKKTVEANFTFKERMARKYMRDYRNSKTALKNADLEARLKDHAEDVPEEEVASSGTSATNSQTRPREAFCPDHKFNFVAAMNCKKCIAIFAKWQKAQEAANPEPAQSEDPKQSPTHTGESSSEGGSGEVLVQTEPGELGDEQSLGLEGLRENPFVKSAARFRKQLTNIAKRMCKRLDINKSQKEFLTDEAEHCAKTLEKASKWPLRPPRAPKQGFCRACGIPVLYAESREGNYFALTLGGGSFDIIQNIAVKVESGDRDALYRAHYPDCPKRKR